MKVPDAALDEVRERGFTIVDGFLAGAELAAAQDGLWSEYPRPQEYFADPAAHERLGRSQFAGLRLFPFSAWPLNCVAYHPDLVDAVERLLGTTDLDLYKVELWAKYTGAIDYDQTLHRDYGNHSLVVPRRDGAYRQITTFVLLSDVGPDDGPTALVPADVSASIPFTPRQLDAGALAEHEVLATGPAGTLLMYRTDILHRGTDLRRPGGSRFALLADYQARGAPWNGKMSWPGRALDHGWHDVLVRGSVRERDLFGWPPPGSDYWDDQTLADVAERWPGIDLGPYRP